MFPTPPAPLLEAQEISKAFPGVQALSEVNLAVYGGEVHVVVGENGAGKSTLMNILSGVYVQDTGVIRVQGEEVTFRDTLAAQEHGVAIIHQELNLIPHLSVAENIFLGRESLTPLGLLDYRHMNRRASALLSQLELPLDPRMPVSRLRVGRQQIVEIAKAMLLDAQVLIMDEPTSAISDHEVEVLFRLVESLKARGVAVVYISHKLDEVFRIGDRMTVLRDGRRVYTGSLDRLAREDVVRLMAGRDVKAVHERKTPLRGSCALRVEKAWLADRKRTGGPIVDNVSLTVCHGEVLGIFGLMGAGRSELLETIFGLHARRSSGKVFVDGVQSTVRSPTDAIAAGIALAPEDRKEDGLVLQMSVGANVSLASLQKIERMMMLSRGAESSLAARYIDRLGIKTPSAQQVVRNLSGGNQQKVILAKWMATDPKILLLDEPTRGIDVNAKREIYQLIDELTADGLAVVMVSSELSEIMAMADRVLVMCEGRKTAEFARGEASEEQILGAALPGSM